MEVKVFQSRNPETLAKEVNECIRHMQVVDIKYSSATEGAYVSYSAMVILTGSLAFNG